MAPGPAISTGNPLPAPPRPSTLRAVAQRPRRLLHVFPGFGIGGSQVRLIALAEGLGERFDHTVLALDGQYEAANLLRPHTPMRLLGTPPTGESLAARLKAFRRELQRIGPDLLLTYNWGAIEMAMANMLGGVPHLHMEDGFGPEETVRQLPRRVWTRRLVLGRSHVVVPSLTLEDIATRRWRLDTRRVHLIPNGISPKLHASRPIEELGLDLPTGVPRIAWAGALRAEKNPLRLIRAFAPLKDQAVLLIMGVGPEREAVLAEAERLNLGSSLRLLGARTDVRDIVMQCQVLALSSDTEQMPLVVLEAMDAGLPVAACAVGDVHRMVAWENRPFVTEANDQALGAALRQLVQDAGLRARVGEANRRKARTTYALPLMVEAYGALIERVIAPTDRRRRSPLPKHWAAKGGGGSKEAGAGKPRADSHHEQAEAGRPTHHRKS
jgi:glycosyltransferase involved in cell wall biosynthesis